MNFKARVYKRIIETRCAEASDADVQLFLDDCSLAHESGAEAGKLVSLDEVHKIFLGTMQNFLTTNCRGEKSDLYTTITDWMQSKADQSKPDDSEVESSDYSVTMVD